MDVLPNDSGGRLGPCVLCQLRAQIAAGEALPAPADTRPPAETRRPAEQPPQVQRVDEGTAAAEVSRLRQLDEWAEILAKQWLDRYSRRAAVHEGAD